MPQPTQCEECALVLLNRPWMDVHFGLSKGPMTGIQNDEALVETTGLVWFTDHGGVGRALRCYYITVASNN